MNAAPLSDSVSSASETSQAEVLAFPDSRGQSNAPTAKPPARKATSSGAVFARVDEARRLLMNPCYSIGEIAQHLGFRSTADFARAFESAAGSSPGAFRARVIPMESPSGRAPSPKHPKPWFCIVIIFNLEPYHGGKNIVAMDWLESEIGPGEPKGGLDPRVREMLDHPNYQCAQHRRSGIND